MHSSHHRKPHKRPSHQHERQKHSVLTCCCCWLQSSLGSDTSHLQRISTSDAAVEEDLASSERADVATLLMDDDSRTVQAVAFNYLRTEWKVLASEVICRLVAPADGAGVRRAAGMENRNASTCLVRCSSRLRRRTGY